MLEIICYYILGWALLHMFRSRPEGGPRSQVAAAALLNNNGGPLDDAVPVNTGNLKRIFRLDTGGGVRGVSASKLTKIVMILTLLTLTVDSCYWLYQRFWHPDLRVTVIDVGDGSATLLEIPGGYTIMIDGGGFSDNSSFDVGARIIAPLFVEKEN